MIPVSRLVSNLTMNPVPTRNAKYDFSIFKSFGILLMAGFLISPEDPRLSM